MQPYSITDLAWAAGFMDGEGTFYISRWYRGKRPIFQPSVSVGQVSRIPLLKLQEMFGGGIYLNRKGGDNLNPKWATIYQWRSTSANAVKIAELLLPYLVLKGEHAEILSAFGYGICTPNVGRNGLPQAEVDRRDALIERLTFLNRTGPR